MRGPQPLPLAFRYIFNQNQPLSFVKAKGVDRAADDVPDNWNFNGSNPCLYRGGNYGQNMNHGPFYVNYNGVSNTNTNIGCRILDKP